MAIQKSKEVASGVTGNYWKIISEVYDKMNMTATYQIALFKDKAASDSDKDHLGLVKTFKFNINIPELAEDRTQLGYTKIKEKATQQVDTSFGIGAPVSVDYDPDLVGGIDV